MIVLFGSIKEFKILEITKRVLQKGKWSFEEFDKNLVNELSEVLNDGGFIFALGKKIEKNKIVKGIYIFRLEKQGDEKILVFDKSIFAEVIREEVLNKFVENLDSILGTLVSERHVTKAFFEEKEFEVKKIKIGKKEVSVMILWLLWGVITSILTKDVIWLCLGVCFGSTSSYTLKVNGEIPSEKKEKSKKKKKK